MFQEVPPVLGWGDALGLFEYLGKYPVVTVARLLRHLRNGKIGGQQEFFCLFHADVGQIGQKSYAYLRFEKLTDILGIQMKLLRQYRQTDFLRQMLLQIPCDALDWPFLLLHLLFGGLSLKQGDLQIGSFFIQMCLLYSSLFTKKYFRGKIKVRRDYKKRIF